MVAQPYGIVLPRGAAHGFAPRPPQAIRVGRQPKIGRDLFVSGGFESVVVLANRTYKEKREITKGLLWADGLWIDKKGNLYVANYADHSTGDYVAEYPPGSSTPSCTYSAGLFDPINVTTDDAGNVYVVDFNFFSDPGYVDKYAQCSNTISAQYSIGKGPEGVAVDGAGDMFVSFFNAGYQGGFEEFKAGSRTPVVLGATVAAAAGLVLDKRGNLITDDILSGDIDVIAPPYSTVNILASGLTNPFHCSLNKKEDLLFNANVGYGSIPPSVTIYRYPSGKLLRTLGSKEGVVNAYGVADSPDAAF